MQNKSLIEEHRKLLIAENVLKNQAKRFASGRGINYKVLTGAVAGVVGAGGAVASKLGDQLPLAYAEKLVEAQKTLSGQELLVQLAEIMSAGHAALEQLAVNGGFLILEASGGTPKRAVQEAVNLSLTI